MSVLNVYNTQEVLTLTYSNMVKCIYHNNLVTLTTTLNAV